MPIDFQYTLIHRILISLFLLLTGTTVQAAKPLWTILSIPGSTPIQIVPENAEATVRYIVKNQTGKFKNLVIWPISGVTQTTPCQLAPQGAAGDICILNLTMTGSQLPRNGIHGGPQLCQANSNGSPNPNQCYQPSNIDSLNITRGPSVGAIITVNPLTLTFPVEGTGVITITNSAASQEMTTNLQIPIPSSSNIRIQSTTCGPNLAVGASCTVTFTATAAQELTNIAIKGSNTNTANLAVQAVLSPALITVTPTTVYVFEHKIFDVTVTTRLTSRTPAQNIAATIPSNSNISVSGSTCGTNLEVGHSCTITFVADTPEGPTTISIDGSNTNTQMVNTTVTNQAHVSITPVQQDRVVPVSSVSLPMNLSYDTIGGPVTSFTVTDKSACPNLLVNDTGCTNISPGNSCTLELSSDTPYLPCMITISGGNSTLIAFSYLNGLVFEVNGSGGKIVTDSPQEFKSAWLNSAGTVNGAFSTSDGTSNTNAIVNNSRCLNAPNYCAAQRCRNIGAEWYLPAIDELRSVYNALCSNNTCNFGGFSTAIGPYYWSSTQSGDNFTILSLDFVFGEVAYEFQTLIDPTRCIRQF